FDRVAEVGPQAGACAGAESFAAPGEGQVLAGEPSAEDVDRFDGRPVDLCDVAQGRDTGPPCGEYLRRFWVELAMPHRFRIEERFDGEVESADTGEQGADGGHVRPQKVSTSTTLVLMTANPYPGTFTSW